MFTDMLDTHRYERHNLRRDGLRSDFEPAGLNASKDTHCYRPGVHSIRQRSDAKNARENELYQTGVSRSAFGLS